jgi:hypothetical protein
LTFDRLGESSGPYDVGYLKTHLVDGGSNACSIYYPVDKGTQANGKPVMLIEYGKDQNIGIKRVLKFIQ